jgi:hypothetical protein
MALAVPPRFAMTIDERLEALTRHLELLSLETEKKNKRLAQLATLVAGVTEGTERLLAKAKRHHPR